MLTEARLRELFDYNPATGEFIRRVSRRGRNCRAGDQAGTIHRRGFRQIHIDRKFYPAARLAVLWMIGRWPQRLVDHINLNPSDDRWSNLREANHSQNGANSRDRPSKIPFKGVTWDRNRGKYAARIRVNYRTINLGRFDNAETAHAAYVAAAEKHFGEFARRQ